MKLIVKKQTLRLLLNTLLRKTQRIEVTKLSTSVLTVKNVYKNKQIIEVSGNFNRCYLPI